MNDAEFNRWLKKNETEARAMYQDYRMDFDYSGSGFSPMSFDEYALYLFKYDAMLSSQEQNLRLVSNSFNFTGTGLIKE